MFLHFLNDQEKGCFLKTARLMEICDNPLLWDGREHDAIAGTTDLRKITFVESSAEVAVMDAFVRECGSDGGFRDVDRMLVDELVAMSLAAQLDPAKRTEAALRVLTRIVEPATTPLAKSLGSATATLLYGRVSIAGLAVKSGVSRWTEAQTSMGDDDDDDEDADESFPGARKAQVFELMLLGLADGAMSEGEEAILKRYSELLEIDAVIYRSLLARAEAFSTEANHTLALILE
jgi:hypothetical protein